MWDSSYFEHLDVRDRVRVRLSHLLPNLVVTRAWVKDVLLRLTSSLAERGVGPTQVVFYELVSLHGHVLSELSAMVSVTVKLGQKDPCQLAGRGLDSQA